MSEREPYPADEAEEREPSDPTSLPAEVPEADAIEQAAPVRDDRPREPDRVGDAPEADAIEQLTEVTEGDEDYRG